MLSGLEVIGVLAALVAAAFLAFVLQKFVGDVEDGMAEMGREESDSSPIIPAKPVRPAGPRRRRR